MTNIITLDIPRSSPELQAIASDAVVRFLKAVQKQGLELHSFILVRHDCVVAEGWWAPYAPERPHMLFSLSKSFASTAIGLLAEEGRISLDDKVISFFPEDTPSDVSSNLASMAIRHLLMMGTGHAQDTAGPMQETDHWVRGFLQLPVEHEPGTQFVYNSGATYLLSAILQQITGQTLLDYLQPRLLKPLGIDGATWESCPRGINFGGWGMKVKTEDIAKFGLLYLHKGQWDGKHLLPEAWVEEATSKQISNGPSTSTDWVQGYGYQFWRCRHNAYRGDGAFGQYCIVMPEQDAVLAITSGVSDMQAVLNAVWEHLLPAMGTEALQENRDAEASLLLELRNLKLEPPRLEASSPLEAEISGVEYELEDNKEGLRALSIRFSEQGGTLLISDNRGMHTFQLGRNEWREGTYTMYTKEENPGCSSMTWRDKNTLLLTTRFVETPFCLTTTCTFGEQNVQLLIQQNVSFGGPEPKPIMGKASV
ncbi:serine hydrolase [Paenibacillus sp. GP183]|uniref:serine hydrolase domain-containing protein n=1 Tax=Paenibacillus sp. GP183 TaxID=1882751 RepID=UPI00089B8F48|nr:serine hydrolase [Paenibacillus sp. GP183]SEC49456.1 CubicO group peptidase, beta-lactamase class C family [Paenibacillus sp. GP183]